jgi:feruloyl esterase
MKKYVLLFVCVLLVFVAGNEVSAKQPSEAVGGTPVIAWQDLMATFSYPRTTLTQVDLALGGSVKVAGIGPMPEHCIVKGKMNERKSPVDGKMYAIGFEMRLPTDWNGRFFYQGNGGTDGIISAAYGNILGGGPTSNGLLKGFAVISSDAGHAMEPNPIGGGVFGIDPQARLDYGYNAVAQLTPMAKKLIKTYYGKFPDKSYIVGTSNGGRHAMVAASRYADEYDGFLAGSPGFNLPQAAVAQLWGVQQYGIISGTTGYASSGCPEVQRPDVWTSFSQADTALVSDSILAKCDALDGVEDDMVGDPLACQDMFNINEDVPSCGDSDEGCLTYGQKSVLARVHAGARNSWGEALYTNFPWDAGIRASGWRTWKFGNSTGNRDPLAVGFIFTVPPQDPLLLNGKCTTLLDYALNWNGTGFDVDKDAPKIYATDDIYTESAMSFMTPPDPLMKRLHTKKGKLIVVHGAADPVFSVADTVNWYDALTARYKKHTAEFARLFIVPGMSHSSGGPACDQFDLVDALVKWVEQGIEPDAITAKARGVGANVVNSEVPTTWAPNRTRPLCAYPSVPMYNGEGKVENASSFTCVEPDRDHHYDRHHEHGWNQ